MGSIKEGGKKVMDSITEIKLNRVNDIKIENCIPKKEKKHLANHEKYLYQSWKNFTFLNLQNFYNSMSSIHSILKKAKDTQKIENTNDQYIK